MTKEEQKKRRIRFNWRDGVAISLVALASAGVFVWSYLSSKTASGETKLYVKYANKYLREDLPVISGDGSKEEYAFSLRKSGATGATNPTSYAEVNLTVSQFQALTDFSSYQKKYLVISSDSSDKFGGFSYLVGPQVDIKIYNGGFQVIKEDSPKHICSNEGFVNHTNLPVACLPNSLEYGLTSASAPSGPDA